MDTVKQNLMARRVTVLRDCLVQTQKAIALHVNDTEDRQYLNQLIDCHQTNNKVLRTIPLITKGDI